MVEYGKRFVEGYYGPRSPGVLEGERAGAQEGRGDLTKAKYRAESGENAAVSGDPHPPAERQGSRADRILANHRSVSRLESSTGDRSHRRRERVIGIDNLVFVVRHTARVHPSSRPRRNR